MRSDDDFDPWSDTTPGVPEVRDDPFDNWPTGSAMGEVTGSHSYEGLIARAAHGGALLHRRHATWVGGASLLLLIVSLIIVGIALTG